MNAPLRSKPCLRALFGTLIACAMALPLSSQEAPATSTTVTSTSRYAEPFRPQYHFTPEVNWMNDPNGLVYFDGEYHLFYQHNPFGNKWGHMSWGHAVSPDLVHWEHLPIAIPEQGEIMAFSGSAVVDWKNASGFGKGDTPPLVAIYTGHRENPPAKQSQSQYLAYSNDRGRTWTPYSGNPVLDLGLEHFRDPKVSWYAPGGYWIMTAVLAAEHKVAFYRSADLKSWKLLSHFGPVAATGGVWECPDLFPLPDPRNPGQEKWVLIVNLNPGGLQGGSGSQYFIGDFDGSTFAADKVDGSVPTRWTDYGRDFYAAVTWSDVPETDGRRLCMGWMNNWEYAQEIPTSPWRSAQSLVRELRLVPDAGDGVRLAQRPIPEYSQLRGRPVALSAQPLPAGRLDLAPRGIRGNVLELKLALDPQHAKETGLVVAAGSDYETRIGYDTKRHVLFIDRTHSGPGFHDNFAGRHEAPLTLADGRLTLHVFLDQSTVEVFAEDGTVAISDQIFPPPGHNGVSLYSEGGDARLFALQAWPLLSVWRNAPQLAPAASTSARQATPP
ncbi:MAG TPA: glycoside hydrolase family 32 protein [Lacunisphaera sp.]